MLYNSSLFADYFATSLVENFHLLANQLSLSSTFSDRRFGVLPAQKIYGRKSILCVQIGLEGLSDCIMLSQEDQNPVTAVT